MPLTQTIGPLNPAQPDKPFYPVDEITNYKRYTRALFYQEFGQQAPPFDPKFPIKRWADTTMTEDKKRFPIIAADGALSEVELSKSDAGFLNLPGLYSFPKYVMAPTPAVMIGPMGFAGGVPPISLSTKSQADKMAADLNAAVADARMAPMNFEPYEQALFGFSINWNGETRRQWALRFMLPDGQTAAQTVGIILNQRNAAGEGAPGKWTINTSGGMVWNTTQVETGELDTRPESIIPIRALLGNERVTPVPLTPFGIGNVLVFRTDRESIFNPKTPTGTGSGASDAKLDKILALLERFKIPLGITD